VRVVAGASANQIGVVVEILEKGIRGKIQFGSGTATMASTDLEPVPPTKKDRCILLAGTHRGQFGTLIGMDNEDAIVKLDTIEDFSIEPFVYLCKVKQ
jgi:hypothetical protein